LFIPRQQFRRPDCDECFLLLAGKKATDSGCVLVAHNNDLHGTEAALLKKYPEQAERPNRIWNFPSGIQIPMPKISHEYLALQIYLGLDEGDCAAVNDKQVAIAGGVSLLADGSPIARQADPLVYDGITAGIRLAALTFCTTARQCVEYLGVMYWKYGVCYPSGVGIADQEEVWYMEQGGGRTWVAVRVPDDSCLVAANGYRIGEIDFNHSNTLTSPDLRGFCIEHGLYDVESGPFNFSKIFGQGRQKYTIDTRRVWGALRHLTPSMIRDAEAREFPLWVRPDSPLSLAVVAGLLRDQYRGTRFDIHSPSSPAGERPISVPSTVHASIIELHQDIAWNCRPVLHACLASPLTSPFIPFYLLVAQIPEAFSVAGPICDRRSAYWQLKILSNLVTPYHRCLAEVVADKWQILEDKWINQQAELQHRIHENPENAAAIFTEYVHGICQEVLDTAESLESILHTRIAAESDKWHHYDASW
jgi:dipeptidase